MTTTKTYIENLFKARGINIPSNRLNLFDEFIKSPECEDIVSSIIEKQNCIMEKWEINNRIADIIAQPITIPNATVGKFYSTKIDFSKYNINNLIYKNFESIEVLGLSFNPETDTIEGNPRQSGEIRLKLLFKIKGETETTLPNIKTISLIINPDPKSLWKDIPSNPNDLFWKKEDICIAKKLGDRNIVASSKRGRSHKNVGSFREDDFSFKHFAKTGWSVVAVSDGAGSSPLSRKGSQLACNLVIEYFKNPKHIEDSKEFESKILELNDSNNEILQKELEVLAKQSLYKATVFIHNKIKEHSEEIFKSNPELFNNPKFRYHSDYYHSTLIFILFKKYNFGYVVLSFGVGDCPIAIMNKEQNETTLLNWLDVGEFGGGTRFITQPEIFHSKEHPMETRFNFKIIPDFSYLFLMTDGIYDPKFEVEANLKKNEKWIAFLADLQGNNDENTLVEFDSSNKEIASQLSNWMDFWSQGNHDDRTLVIIF